MKQQQPRQQPHLTAAVLKDWRDQMQVDRGEAAEMLGISRGWYNMLESGKAPVSKTLAAACAYFLIEKTGKWIRTTRLLDKH